MDYVGESGQRYERIGGCPRCGGPMTDVRDEGLVVSSVGADGGVGKGQDQGAGRIKQCTGPAPRRGEARSRATLDSPAGAVLALSYDPSAAPPPDGAFAPRAVSASATGRGPAQAVESVDRARCIACSERVG